MSKSILYRQINSWEKKWGNLGFFYTLKEISELNMGKPFANKEKMKKDISILVIDDKEVPFLEILKNNDYPIKHHTDVKDMSIFKSYDIILCDIKGVGKSLNPKLQGVHLVKEIKKLYPFKQVIAFTANPTDPDIMTHLMGVPDDFLKKDASETEWIEALDRCIERFSDPVKQWINIRTLLLKQHVSTKTAAHLENNYVRSVQKNNKNILIDSLKDHPTITPEMKDALIGLLGLIGKLAAQS